MAGFSNSSLGALSSANKETRILRLIAYLNHTTKQKFNIQTALNKAETKSWKTFINYLTIINKEKQNELTHQGQENYLIALNESTFLKQLQKK